MKRGEERKHAKKIEDGTGWGKVMADRRKKWEEEKKRRRKTKEEEEEKERFVKD